MMDDIDNYDPTKGKRGPDLNRLQAAFNLFFGAGNSPSHSMTADYAGLPVANIGDQTDLMQRAALIQALSKGKQNEKIPPKINSF